ncbi:3-methyl-2-oxobutanoate hydroxymethyltransferase, partial [Candidatus Bathyarchaeota archaeon]|nr:3-methyl-2-oxobutanoate hydroxymethyltransferase [Candidatus Bathyarchaeota archaeon]
MKFEDDIRQKKGKEKIVVLTAYDYQIAKILDDGPINMILVGDSLGMVFQGQNNTKQVTMKNMIYHTKAVARGAR